MDRNWTNFCRVVVSMAAIFWLVGVAKAKGVYSEQLAAWVQAFGTIAALAATAWAASAPIHAEERRRAAERLDLGTRVIEVIDLSEPSAKRLRDAIAIQDAHAFELSALTNNSEDPNTSVLLALRDLPMTWWPRPLMQLLALGAFNAHNSLIIQSYQAVNTKGAPVNIVWADQQANCDRRDAAIGRLRKAMKDWLDQR